MPYFYAAVPRRVQLREDRGLGIIKYGIGNIYPQLVDYAVAGCEPAATACEVYADFMVGSGFQDAAVNALEVDREGRTALSILEAISEDFARFRGFALHFNYNLLGQIVEINHLPFEWCRLSEPDENGDSRFVKVWDNWAGESLRLNASIADIRSYHRFAPANALEEVAAVGIDDYKGQVLYFSENRSQYPIPPVDAVLNQCFAFASIAEFDKSFSQNGFSASTVFRSKSYSPDEATYQRNIEQIRTLGGTRNAGGIGYLEGDIDQLQITLPKVWEERAGLKSSIKDDVYERFSLPHILTARTRQGGFPNKDEMADAVRFYNAKTRKNRTAISDQLARVFAASIWTEASAAIAQFRLD